LEAALAEYAESVVSVTEFDAARFVTDIEAGPVAWVDGASEIGPRALGHRSLLADPRTERSRDALNRIKHRQWWRPVAPVVLEEHVADWFAGGRRSPYMLEVFDVETDRRPLVPAITHLDGTARLQSLAASDDARLHAAVSAFAESTGVPLLCNTSLNAKGEPIIQTAAQAAEFCLAEGVDVLYVDGFRVLLRRVPRHQPKHLPAPRRAELFAGQEPARDALWEQLAEQGVGAEVMALVARAPQFARMLDDESARAKLRAVAAQTTAADPAWSVYIDHLVAMYGPGGSFEGAFGESGATEEALMPIVSELLQRPGRAEQTGGLQR
jgi:hypothetical protein